MNALSPEIMLLRGLPDAAATLAPHTRCVVLLGCPLVGGSANGDYRRGAYSANLHADSHSASMAEKEASR